MATTASKLPRKPIPTSQQKLVWAYSAGYCAFPGCTLRTLMTATPSDGAVVIGEVAHIHAYEDDGPRANMKLSLKERNSYPNLMLLCPNHHSLIDKQPNTYPADMLRQWKRVIESKITTTLRNAMPAIHFSELEQITNVLTAHVGAQGSDLSVIPPADKIKKNNLSHTAHTYLAIALAKADVVGSFINAFTKLDDSFAARLRTGFVLEYERLKADGAVGDELFQDMLAFATAGKSDLKTQAAGLAVLGYFFEACEVFEK